MEGEPCKLFIVIYLCVGYFVVHRLCIFVESLLYAEKESCREYYTKQCADCGKRRESSRRIIIIIAISHVCNINWVERPMRREFALGISKYICAIFKLAIQCGVVAFIRVSMSLAEFIVNATVFSFLIYSHAHDTLRFGLFGHRYGRVEWNVNCFSRWAHCGSWPVRDSYGHIFNYEMCVSNRKNA